MDSLCFNVGIRGITLSIAYAGRPRTNSSRVKAAVGRTTASANGISVEKRTISAPQPWGFSLGHPLRSLWMGGGKRYDAIAVDDAAVVEDKEQGKEGGIGGEESERGEGQKESWVLKILHVRSLWREEGKEGVEELGEDNGSENDRSSECSKGEYGYCDLCRVDDKDDEEMEFHEDSFSKLLRRVSLVEAKLYAKMSYLGILAYLIPQIKPGNLLENHGLRYVTSSLEKKEMAMRAEKERGLGEGEEAVDEATKEVEEEEDKEPKIDGRKISAAAAYQIAASAASYLYSHTKSILPFKSRIAEACEDSPEGCSRMTDEVMSFMATTDSVTAVVAAKEEVKQAVADDLNSTSSSPCGWFVCDDDQTGTRLFVIQGSETLASWQANLLFEPIKFEGMDVLVHRGIYEAAKGIYEQMLPEILAHLKSKGHRATFQFTGHSLGGSLSLLLNLMLLIRGEVPPSSLLPVITFGAPSIMCGGDRLLRELGLPRSHVRAITMHRDIVPRAFSCSYPNHVAELLKAVNVNFRNHPCLKNQKLLYAPMGEFLILQPDNSFAPHHHLLPSGCGLYLLSCPVSDHLEAEKQLKGAKAVFLNSPHPLEILGDRSSYGPHGTIQRDHDMKSYLKCIRHVIRQELNSIRKNRREHWQDMWWPLMARHIHRHNIDVGMALGRPVASGQKQGNFYGILRGGRESIKRLRRLVALRDMHLLVLLFFSARCLILGVYSTVSFHG